MLTILIVASTLESVEQLKFMVAKHLAQFDRHHRLTLEWTSPDTTEVDA